VPSILAIALSEGVDFPALLLVRLPSQNAQPASKTTPSVIPTSIPALSPVDSADFWLDEGEEFVALVEAASAVSEEVVDFDEGDGFVAPVEAELDVSEGADFVEV
jgi:hypothetical protein